MRAAAAMALLAAGALGAAEKPRVARPALAAVEKSLDQRIRRLDAAEPFDLLGATRGVYLEGYGAVFTAEVNLMIVPALSPFRPTLTKEEIDKVHQKKLQRLPLLKQSMRAMLRELAAALDTVPAQEQIVLGVSLFYFSWEQRQDLPSQILMQGRRQALLAAEPAIRVEEF